jgi:CNT family concentrative nucleoside transporter
MSKKRKKPAPAAAPAASAPAAAPVPPDPTPPAKPRPEPAEPPAPRGSWGNFELRLACGLGAAALAAAAYVLQGTIPGKIQAVCGIACFLLVICTCSSNLRRVSWKTVFWGMVIQIGLAVMILKLDLPKYTFTLNGQERYIGGPVVYDFFRIIAEAITTLLGFTAAGSGLVFGDLSKGVFAFTVLPAIVFISSLSTVLYYFGVLQAVVKVMAKGMMALMGTSGAETLSASANVFMGQTEAPLVVKPYVPTMTRSELLTIMTGGMATISGSLMAVYITFGADPVAILTTSVMAAPCGLYLSKILIPETEAPVTAGNASLKSETPFANAVDAASAGASDGMSLAINVAAMLIAFLAIIALINALLGWVHPALSLDAIFARLFAPIAVLMGVTGPDVPKVAELLGTKLVVNEFIAFQKLTKDFGPASAAAMSPAAFKLSTYALTGFANLGSIGIQIGGIGGMAPTRRAEIARLGGKCLLAGFVATLINSCVASILM